MSAEEQGRSKSRESGTKNKKQATEKVASGDSKTETSIPVSTIPPNAAPPPLASAPLAYENPGFLNGPDGRLIRIVAEYMEPFARIRHEHIQKKVVFFGSARFR